MVIIILAKNSIDGLATVAGNDNGGYDDLMVVVYLVIVAAGDTL